MILSDDDLTARPHDLPPRGTHDTYAEIPALNWSTLKHLAVSALMLRWRVDHPQEDSRSLALGRAIHCAVLEPERWASAYVAQPDFGDGRYKAAKEAKAAWLLDLPPAAEVLSADDHALAERCAAAVRAHPVAADLLRGGRAEEVIRWTDEETGIACKMRGDFITPAGLLDLKSTRQPTVRAMARDFASRLYHGQLAYYHSGAIAARLIPSSAEPPRVIAVQTVEPYDVVCSRLRLADLERGIGLCRTLVRRYAACQAASYWPGLAPGLIDLELPAWSPGGDGATEEDW